ncbi:MAG: PIG-L deacetylase family protein [Gammaproteobacteria bacterium]
MQNVLFLLAHNDDEYFAALRMREEIRLGNRVLVAYLTHGSVRGADSAARMQDSVKFLSKLGIRQDKILAIGRGQDILDFRLHERVVDAYRGLGEVLENIAIERLYIMAWEGGHPDHDASHLIGVAFARQRKLEEVYEFPAYSRFRVMHPLHKDFELLTTGTSRIEAFKTLVSGFSYRNQRRTFLAMLPGSVVQLLLLGHQNYWRVPHDRDYAQAPHAGRLFYERRYGISFADFTKNVRALYQNL